jgi:hypothetical protein
MDLGNATKGAIAFSRITIWGGVKASGCREIADTHLAWLATQACRRPQVPKEVSGWPSQTEYRWLTDPGRE